MLSPCPSQSEPFPSPSILLKPPLGRRPGERKCGFRAVLSSATNPPHPASPYPLFPPTASSFLTPDSRLFGGVLLIPQTLNFGERTNDCFVLNTVMPT